jgi:predicted HTH transcriptional regulator
MVLLSKDVATLGHGPGLAFDFENSLCRSKTETSRYEFKQGILRLDGGRQVDEPFIGSMIATISAIANLGPDAEGFVYLGIADSAKDTARIVKIDGVNPIRFEYVDIVGIDREANALGRPLDRYRRILEDTISGSELGEPLKTQLLASVDVVSYKGLSVVRFRVPKQREPTFVGDKCFIRVGSATKLASGPEIAAVSKLFS